MIQCGEQSRCLQDPTTGSHFGEIHVNKSLGNILIALGCILAGIWLVGELQARKVSSVKEVKEAIGLGNSLPNLRHPTDKPHTAPKAPAAALPRAERFEPTGCKQVQISEWTLGCPTGYDGTGITLAAHYCPGGEWGVWKVVDDQCRVNAAAVNVRN